MSTSSAPAAPSLASFARRHDPDRFLCALFAPAAHRETLFTLYAFNHEIARACEVTREPGLALIRLQWWREVVEGQFKTHEVAAPLHIELSAGRLAPEDLLCMLDAREREAEGGFDTLADWTTWLLQGAGSLAVAAARALGAPDGDLARHRTLGAGVGVMGQLRNIDALAAQGRCLLPRALLADHALTIEEVIGGPRAQSTSPVRIAVATSGIALLGAPQRCSRAVVAAGLPAVLARRDSRTPLALGASRGIVDRLAVLRAGALGQC